MRALFEAQIVKSDTASHVSRRGDEAGGEDAAVKFALPKLTSACSKPRKLFVMQHRWWEA
jgi:hypothetical protein